MVEIKEHLEIVLDICNKIKDIKVIEITGI